MFAENFAVYGVRKVWRQRYFVQAIDVDGRSYSSLALEMSDNCVHMIGDN